MADGATDINARPTEDISVRQVFGIDTPMLVKGFAGRAERVPDIDPTYKFDPETTLAILAAFAHNRRLFDSVKAHIAARSPGPLKPEHPPAPTG